MTVSEAVLARRATPVFDESVAIGRSELVALMNRACLAPSALNLQPWRFIICSKDEDKARLWQVSFRQDKVRQASASIVVLGDLQHHQNAFRIADGNVVPGEGTKEGWVALAHETYADDPVRARDEAIRGCSLWAMTFALLACEAGWDTSLIGGFDESGLRQSFGVEARYVPVLLIAVGRRAPTAELRPRAERLRVEDLLL